MYFKDLIRLLSTSMLMHAKFEADSQLEEGHFFMQLKTG
jgi:hypothetical protein